MNFKLSPYQYHALDPRRRMAASLSGLAGFASAAETKGPNGSGAQLIPDSRFKTMVTSVLQAPEVGSGLSRGYRAALTPSADRFNYMDHGLEDGLASVPRYTHAQNSNRNPFVATVARGLAGLGIIKNTDADPVEMANRRAAAQTVAAPAPTGPVTMDVDALARNMEARGSMAKENYALRSEADKARREALLAQQRAKDALRERNEALAREAAAKAEAEANTPPPTINPDAVDLVDTNLAPATIGSKSNTLLYVGAAAVGLGALYLLFKKA